MESAKIDACIDRLEQLYQRMDEEYGRVAGELGFSCEGCDDNCCDSPFVHHTYIEWIYLVRGIRKMGADVQARLVAVSREYLNRINLLRAKGEDPVSMCPLNEGGRCMAYEHRMMICRLHGVPSSITMPGGGKKEFGGCFRCQEIIAGKNDFPVLDRTPLLSELAAIERDLLSAAGPKPRVKLSIAEMIIKGEPEL